MKITVSLPPDLVAFADKAAKQRRRRDQNCLPNYSRQNKCVNSSGATSIAMAGTSLTTTRPGASTNDAEWRRRMK